MHTKNRISEIVKADLLKKNLVISAEDFERPWGGFFKISNESLTDFLSIFFSGIKLPLDVDKFNVSPKILIVQPGKKLSWQSHERRSELWRIVQGPVGIYMSPDDIQPDEMSIYNVGDTVEMNLGTRHRLVGLEEWGIVAEIWIHKFPDNPSDENDIRRIQDDFGR